MNVILILCAVIFFVFAKPNNQVVYKVPPAVAMNAYKFANPCIAETNADSDILPKLLDATLSNDDVSKKFVYCFSVSGGFVDKEGHFNITRMSSLLGNHPLVKPFEEVLAECNKITKETPMETTFEMGLCLTHNAPVRFEL